jgi:hypothetical protein
MSASRVYIDPMTDELLLYQWSTEYNGWTPNITAMKTWRTGTLRIYRKENQPLSFVTIPGRVHHPVMTDTEVRDICGTASKPWIPVASIPTLTDDDMVEFDVWSYAMGVTTMPIPTTWEAAACPLLHYDDEIRPHFFPSYNQDDAITTRMHVPSAPPAEEQSSTSTSTSPSLPHHVAAIVLDSAVTTHAICPISMEPIQQTGFSVTGCGHVFKTTALRRWITEHRTCPECRTPTGVTAF